MSANVELVKGFYLSKLPVMKSLVHPDAVISEAGGLPYSGEWFGPDGWEDLMLKISGLFRFRMFKQDVYDLDHELVLRLADVEFTSRDTGRAAPMQLNEVHRLRDGLVIGVDIFYKDASIIASLTDERV